MPIMHLVSLVLLTSSSLGLAKPFTQNVGNGLSKALTHSSVALNTACGPPSGDLCSRDTATTLQDCLAAKNVPVYFSTSTGFSQLAEPYNLRLAYTPAVIVVPTLAGQISDAVLCAAASNVKVQAKSGGHSYASYSSGGQDGSMVIDLQAYQDITVDPEEYFAAKVGAGVRLGDLALGLYNQSQRALPHGTCPGVGIGGHATHGGFGLTSRLWGLTLDHIIGADVVLANGSFIHTSATEYPDIFYALRGAADSFGIIVYFYFQTRPAPDTIVNWSYSIPNMFVNATTSAAVFGQIQEFALDASVVDRNLTFGVYLDGSTFSISGAYIGALTTFTDTIAPALLSRLPTPTTSTLAPLNWIDFLTHLAAPLPLQQPTTGYNLHNDFFAKSLSVPSSSPLTPDALEAYFTYIIQHGIDPPSPWFSIINLYGGPDSQINVPSSTSSAHSDRSALWVLQHYASTPNTGSAFPAADFPFIGGLNDALTTSMPGTVFGAYANYVDPSMSAEEAHGKYFDEETYARLVGIKGVVDPGNVFWNPQAVGA